MATYPIAAGQPDLSGTFIPSVWSGRLLEEFYKTTVYMEIANTNYEGEIKEGGETVHIRQVVSHNVRDYTKGQKLQIDTLSKAVVDLNIDKGKYFSFVVDSIDQYQSDMDLMGDWAEGAAKDLKVAIDLEILAYLPSEVSSTNKGATAGAVSNYNMGTTGAPVAITLNNVLKYFTYLSTILDESNVPPDDRWIVIPPWLGNAIQNSDLKNASFSGLDSSLLLRGLIGSLAGLKIFVSNNLTSVSDTDTCWNIVAGHKSALSFASQVVISRNLEDAEVLGKIIQMVNVYGRKLVKTDAAALLYCKNNTV